MTTYTLPDLPYPYDALAPHVSVKVLELHHDKHHAAYVKGANDALAKLSDPALDKSVTAKAMEDLAFNLSGHVLHSVYWTSMGPDGERRPTGALAEAVQQRFGGFDGLKTQLDTAVTSLQGSGWAALVWEPFGGTISVMRVHDHQSELVPGSEALFVIDGWEHAYYLDRYNDKAAYLEAFWNVADWRTAARRFSEVRTLVNA